MPDGPEPSAPQYVTLAATDNWTTRVIGMSINYMNHPSLISEVPTGQLWNCLPSAKLDPDEGISITHHTKTLLVTDPAYTEVFEQTAVNSEPGIHHVTFKIGTRITDREEGRAYELLFSVKCYDAQNNAFVAEDGPSGIWHDVGGWAYASADTLLPIIRDIFADWRCVVEHFKYHLNGDGVGIVNPLLCMHILGDGPTFRKTTLRIRGNITMVIGLFGGTGIFVDNRKWQELRNGRWEYL